LTAMSLSKELRPMSPIERQTLLAHLHPSPSWLSRLFGMFAKSAEILQGKEDLEGDCRDGVVEVLTVEVMRYAIGDECNDEGPIYFFEVGQNDLLVLWGQWLCDPHVVTSYLLDLDELWEQNAWFKHFELVRSPSSGIVLSLKSIGRETVSSVGTVCAGQRLPPQPSAVIPGNLEMLLGDASRA